MGTRPKTSNTVCSMAGMPLLKVVEIYQQLIRRAIERLETEYGEVSPSRVWDEEIPRKGRLPGLSFHFHGVGCTAQIDGYTVNWDWDREGRTDAFEAWKLWQMTRDHPQEFGLWAQLEPIKEELARLCVSGAVIPANEWGVLYRLAPSA